MSLTGDFHASVSMLSVWPSALSPAELHAVFATCVADDSEAILPWSTFLASDISTNVAMAFPTTCGGEPKVS